MERIKVYSAQEVASILGISKQTLYRYEKKKIIPIAKRNQVNKWREYAPDDVRRLKSILGR